MVIRDEGEHHMLTFFGIVKLHSQRFKIFRLTLAWIKNSVTWLYLNARIVISKAFRK